MDYLFSYLRAGEVFYIIISVKEGIWFGEDALDIILDILYDMNEKEYFLLFGFSFLPYELHIILHPEHKRKIDSIVRSFKKRVTRTLKVFKGISFPVWERDFKKKVVISRDELLAILSHIHRLPLEKGIIDSVDRYRYSSSYPGNVTDLDTIW